MLLALLLAIAQPSVEMGAQAAGHPAGGLDAPDPDQLLDAEDYPQFALVRDLSAASLVELYVSPQGRVMECGAGKGWGDGELAGAMCDILRHKHLPPAHLADGTPAYGVLRGVARLFIPGTRGGDEILRLSPPADVELQALHLPGGADRAEVRLLLSVTPAGTIAACAPARDERQLDMARSICPALHDLKPGQRVGLDGVGVPYVMTVRAGLSAQDNPPAQAEAPPPAP